MASRRSEAVMEHFRTLYGVGTVGALSDGHLLDRFVARRDEAAFAALVERHGPMVHRVCRQVLGDPHDAQDASQAVFLVLARRARSIRSRGSLASWLHGVALRTAAKARTAAARRRAHERRGGARRAREAGDRAPGEGPSWPELHEELDRLPEKFRMPIVLCQLEGLSREAAAQQLGWPVGTVQSRLARGQERLRSRLVRRGVALSAGLAEGGLGVDTATSAMPAAWASATVRAAMRVASGESVASAASAPVASMTREALRAMVVRKVKGAAIAALACGLLATGGWSLARQHPPAPPGRPEGAEDGREAPQVGLTPDVPSTRLEDLLEVAMRANEGRATGPTWKSPAGAGERGQPAAVDGRVVDLQGRPVAGARLWVLAIKRPPGGDLGPFLASLAAARRGDDLWRAWHDMPDASPSARPPDGDSATIQPPATSADDGRVRLEGVGSGHAVLALIEGPTIESKPVIIVTRPGPATRVRGLDGFAGLTVHGASFEHVAAPGRAIEGTVRDRETGEPLPGISVRAASARSFTGLTGYVRATSDARGRYRLVGVAEGARDRVAAIPPADRPYLPASEGVEVGRGDDPTRLDLPLSRGVWIRGRVMDEASGRPVMAEVEFHTFRDNPRLGPDPGYEMGGTGTAPDGTFRLLGLPGRGIVAARTRDSRYVRGVGLDALFPGLSRQDMLVATYPPFGNVEVVNVVVGIDPGEDAAEVSCELELATGKTRTGTVLGPDGKPLAGFAVNELTPGEYAVAPSPTPEFAVTALRPREERRLVFRHEGRRLIGTLVVTGDGAGPLTVTLGPWASLAGRLLDEDGEPRTDVAILLHHGAYPVHALGGMARQPSRFAIAEDGRFRIDALAPGVKYDLDVISDMGIVGYVAKGLVVRAGEAKDLGDRKVIDITR